MSAADVSTVQDEIGNRLSEVIREHKARIEQTMKADRAQKDSPAAYASVYSRCSPKEWEGRRRR